MAQKQNSGKMDEFDHHSNWEEVKERYFSDDIHVQKLADSVWESHRNNAEKADKSYQLLNLLDNHCRLYQLNSPGEPGDQHKRLVIINRLCERLDKEYGLDDPSHLLEFDLPNAPMSGLIDAPHIYSNISVTLYSHDGNIEIGEIECLYNQAGRYADIINQHISRSALEENHDNNLMQRFYHEDMDNYDFHLARKVASATPSVVAVGDTLYGCLRLELNQDLTENEYEIFVSRIEHQYKDGWGSDFELQDIPVDENQYIAVRFDTGDMYFIMDLLEEPDCGPTALNEPQL